MNIERDKFLSAVMATALATAAIGCGEDPPPPAAEEPQSSVGAEEPIAQAAPEPEPAPAPVAQPEPTPEVEQVGPTVE